MARREAELAQGREKVAARSREGISYEKSFGEVSNTLVAHLRTKPECRDLMNELLNNAQVAPPPESTEPKPTPAAVRL